MGDRPLPRVCARVFATLLFVGLVSSASVALAAPAGAVLAFGAARSTALPSGGFGVATIGTAKDIPGTVLETPSRTTVFKGNLAVDYDQDDVHGVFLWAGEVVSLSLTGAAGTDYGFFVFGPEATSTADSDIFDAAPPAYYQGGDYPHAVSFKVPETGEYYVDVCTFAYEGYNGGSGYYDLTVGIERSGTQVQILAPSTVSYGAVTGIEGLVTDRWDQAVAGDVALSFSLNGLNYLPLMVQGSADGSFYFETWPFATTVYYLAQYEGSDAYSPSAQHVVVKMRAALTGASGSRYGTRSYTLYGYISPKHAAGSSVARLYLWRSVGGHWRAYGYRTLRASDSGTRTKYSVKYKFPYAGRWRMRAYHSDAGHATTWSGYTYLTVR